MPSDANSFVDLLERVATALIGARDELNRLDAVAGDGDLGLTASNGARALLELAPLLRELPEAEAIGRCGREIARSAPSTGGTLLAFAFMAAGRAGVDPAASGPRRAAAYLEAGAAAIAERGKVGSGDRTMVDALAPAIAALQGALQAGVDDVAASDAAAVAAEAGARATTTMAAKVGRAGWLADRAAGSEDAGARLVALAFRAAAAAIAETGGGGQATGGQATGGQGAGVEAAGGV